MRNVSNYVKIPPVIRKVVLYNIQPFSTVSDRSNHTKDTSTASTETNSNSTKKSIHEKDPALVERASSATVQSVTANVGQEQFKLFQQMQQNPKLLEGSWGLEHSSQQRAIEESRLQLPDAFDMNQYKTDKTVDNQLIQSPFGPRPPEAGPGDQLILHPGNEDELLNLSELLEIFAKHRNHPEKFSISKLALEYELDENDIRCLLRYVQPPTYVRHEREWYGVYEIRDFDSHGNMYTFSKPLGMYDPTIHGNLRNKTNIRKLEAQHELGSTGTTTRATTTGTQQQQQQQQQQEQGREQQQQRNETLVMDSLNNTTNQQNETRQSFSDPNSPNHKGPQSFLVRDETSPWNPPGRHRGVQPERLRAGLDENDR